ncbi:MAG TPA: Rieske (2Fe-2S) protein [Gammaproteobacteria bacterium]|nr:Rieske (2Fe-2S) protein [Gammaproteobacteria bacterium]
MAERRETAIAQRNLKRRRVLQACCGLALCSRAARGDETEDAVAAPQAGDSLVFAYGDRAGQVIAPADVVLGAKQLLAYPKASGTGRIRDGSRLNQLVVVRLSPDKLSAETRMRAADGVVAYSGVCTHTGCDVTDWYGDSLRFKCPCHESEFDPSDGARVVGGPAPWQLAALPLKLVDGALAVAGAFEGRVGFQPPGLDPFGAGPQ